MDERLPRKLVAILYADVAGYSRLTGEDEDATHRKLSEYLDQIAATIERYGGRVMHYAGDAVLAMFEAVVDALACAADIQKDLKVRNEALSDERKVQFRIGVNMGDVIEDRGDIYGDGVNVAARLESLAEPGGICVSESVHTAVGSKLPFDYEFLGEQEVKNITKPVRAYSAHLKPGATSPTPTVRPKPRRPQHHVMAATGAALVLVIGAGVITWWQPWQAREEPASFEHMAYPLPDKPSIAVLPFDNLSGDKEQEYFSDGMTDDVITDLSKISGLFVIARNSTFTYKGKPTKIRQVAEELGVRYVLEGSVRKVGNQVRINAQLIDASTGTHLWAERYDGELTDILGLQDRITSKIVAALAVNLTTEEAAARSQLETGNPAAYDAFLQGWARVQQDTPADYAKAIDFFEEAIKHDAAFSRAYAALALAHWQIAYRGWASQVGLRWQETVNKVKYYLSRAKQKPTSLAHSVASEVLRWRGQYDEAVTEAEQAIHLDPNEPAAYLALGRALTRSGRPEDGAKVIKKAIRLNPHYPPGYLRVLGRAQYGMEQFDEAAATFERAGKRAPDYEFTYLWLAATYGQLGREEEAKAAIEKLNAILAKRGAPPYTLSRVGVWGGYKKREDEERVREGLRKAGVPPGADPSTVYRKLVTETSNGFEVKGATKIDVATAKTLFDRGATFVDVRRPDEWREGTIPGAVLLELHNDLSEDRITKAVGRDDEVVFYCSGTSCYKSAHACAKALTWGFRNVYYFAEGFPGWQDAGARVEVPSG